MARVIENFRLPLWAAGVAFVAFASTARAQFWSGNVNGNWSNASNWSPTGVPTSGINTQLTFGLTTSPTMTDDISGTFLLNQMIFTGTSPTYTLGGNGLDFRNNSSSFGPSIYMNSNNNVTIANALTLTGTPSVTGTGTGTITLNGVIGGAGGLSYSGSGTLILGNANNNYSGGFAGTNVTSGTVQLGNGAAIPAGGTVTVLSGATFSTGGLSNGTTTSSSRVVQTLNVDGGTFRVPSGSGDYWINNLFMSGGAVDFTGATNSWLHFANAGAAINLDANSTNYWIGAGSCRFQNNTSGPLTVTLGNGAELNAGVILSSGGTNPNFTFTGGGFVNLTNTGNTANITNSTSISTTDLSTNVGGAGAFGVLGTGTFTLAGGVLEYFGPAAVCAKPVTLSGFGGLYVGGVNLTMSGVISQAVPNSQLSINGSFGGPDGTVTLTGVNTYNGPTAVFSQIVAIPTIANGGATSPIGAASNAPANLSLGSTSGGGMDFRGTLLLTGANSSYSTDRGATVAGLYSNGGGGAIGVQTGITTLTVSGQITGSGSFIKTGAGTLVLSNATNNYTGGTYVEGGRLSLGAGTALPAGLDVTMSAGTELNTNGFGIPIANAIGTLNLNGGALLRIAASGNNFTLNRLATDAGGGIVDTANAAGSGVNVAGAGAAITINGNSTWAGAPNSFVFALNTSEVPLTIAPFKTLTSALSLATGNGASFRVTGGGTLHLTQSPAYFARVTVNHARLQMDSLVNVNSATFNLTLDNGTLAYGGASVPLPGPFSLGPGGGTLEITNANTILTLGGTINGTDAAPFTKTGPGVLVLNNQVGSLLGGLIVSNGRLDVGADSNLGLATPTINGAGTLRFTSTDSTARTFTLNGGTLEAPAGVTVNLNGATVAGGFLKGPGAFGVIGGTTIVGSSTANNTVVNVFGAGSLINFSNSGTLLAAGIGGMPTTLSNFFNQGSGTMTLGATSVVNAADFQTYGTLTINPATITQNYSQTTLMTNTGTTPLSFNGGSRTFVGTASTAVFPSNWPDVSLRGTPTFVAGIDLSGKNAIVAGGLFVNNGYVEDSTNGFAGTATIVADFGSLVKGAGFFQNTVQTVNGGKFQAGNSPGAVTFGKFVLGPGGVSSYVFAIDDATGAAGPSPDAAGHVSGWGLVKAISHVTGMATSPGDFVWTATPGDKLLVSLETLVNPTTVGIDVPGMMDHFDPSRSYVWPAVEWTGSYAGPADVATLDAATSFDTSGFANSFAGSFGWALDAGGHTLSLTFTPSAVPEPGSLVLVGLAVAAGGWWRHRIAASPN